MSEISGGGTRTSGQFPGNKACSYKGDAKSDAAPANWAQLKPLILACDELPADIRQQMVEIAEGVAP